jgi:hypothetical protein
MTTPTSQENVAYAIGFFAGMLSCAGASAVGYWLFKIVAL